MPRVGTPEDLLEKLESIRDETKQIIRVQCPHCQRRWTPKRTKAPKYCIRCHRKLTTEHGDSLREKKEIPNLVDIERFTPAAMKSLIVLKLYSYAGMPEDLPDLTFGRQRQRAANLKLTDRYLRSELSITDMADALRIERQGAHMRIAKGFSIMLDRGCFRLTAKGRENVARGKMKAGIK